VPLGGEGRKKNKCAVRTDRLKTREIHYHTGFGVIQVPSLVGIQKL